MLRVAEMMGSLFAGKNDFMVKSGNMVRQVRKEFEVRTAINFV
jgi:hypothetical protein